MHAYDIKLYCIASKALVVFLTSYFPLGASCHGHMICNLVHMWEMENVKILKHITHDGQTLALIYCK